MPLDDIRIITEEARDIAHEICLACHDHGEEPNFCGIEGDDLDRLNEKVGRPLTEDEIDLAYDEVVDYMDNWTGPPKWTCPTTGETRTGRYRGRQ